MNERKPRSRGWLLLLVAAVAVATLVGSAFGKYLRSFTLQDATVTFTAKLATSISLQEHKATRLPDGSYVLNKGEAVVENEYTLIPGLDIPKDPYITIEGKTPIPAFLFVEVVEQIPNDAVSYKMTSDWKKLNVTGKNGGTVYVYTGDGLTPEVVDEKVGASFTVFLLQNDQITVGQNLLHSAPTSTLTFYACMGETAFSGETDPVKKAVDVYQKLNNITP